MAYHECRYEERPEIGADVYGIIRYGVHEDREDWIRWAGDKWVYCVNDVPVEFDENDVDTGFHVIGWHDTIDETCE